MTLTLDTPLCDLLLARPETMPLLEALGVDYCCGGHRSLREAAHLVGQDPDQLLARLAEYRAPVADASLSRDWSGASLTELLAHIEASHHAFLRQQLPRLEVLLEKVLEAHGERHPELDEVFDLFQSLARDLMPHLLKEEQILFPFIRHLETGQAPEACFTSVQSPIRAMEAEHEAVGQLLAQLRAVTAGYTVPADGCATFRALYEGLQALEADTHRHIYLENQLVHPRAQALEAALQP